MLQVEQSKLRVGGSSNLTLLVLVSMLLGAGAWEMLKPSQVHAAIPNPDLVRAEMLKEMKALRTSQDATGVEIKAIRTLLASGTMTVKVVSQSAAKPTKKTTSTKRTK